MSTVERQAKIRMILVNTSHPGNIGGAARAMKNMGLTELYLVQPKEYPAPRAVWRAAGARDLLANARIVESVDEAIKGCGLVVGTSARERRIPWPLINPRECGMKIWQESEHNDIGLDVSSPTPLRRTGERKELIAIAGSVEIIPAINIHSASRRVVGSPKYEFEVDHHAKTGVEKPTMNAGMATRANRTPVKMFSPITSNGNMHTVLKKTPAKNSHHNCLPSGISSGVVSRIK